jgi:hypothetical protein
MLNKDISQAVLDDIKKDNIKPFARSGFVVKKMVFWLIAFLSVILGSLAAAVTIFLFVDSDLSAVSRLGVSSALRVLPYFWFIFLAIFLALGEYYFHKTSFGYRYRLAVVAVIYIAITAIFGSIGYGAGVGGSIEAVIADNLPLYHKYLYNKEAIWTNPDKGLLSGEIKAVNGEKILLVDFKGNVWEIDLADSALRGRAVIGFGEKIRIIGTKTGENMFKADEVRPWQGCGMEQQHGAGMCGRMLR